MNSRLRHLIPFALLIYLCCIQDALSYNKTTIMIHMRDDTSLSTDIYKPSIDNIQWPTILIRTPYGKNSAMDDLIAFILTDIFQYALVIQDTRGRGDSEGADSLYFSDGWGRVRDGYDTVEWIAEQSWSDGKIGTWGASALGMTQYFMTGAAPPHLTCCLVMVAASNLYEDALFYGGEYRKSLVDDWLTKNNSEHLIDFFVQHPNYEPLYDVINLSTRYDSVNVPILHIGGWHDIFVQGQINAFCGIQEKGGVNAAGNQKLIIGPWIHDIISFSSGELTFPGSGSIDFIKLMVDWFDYWLKDKENGIHDIPAVQYYLIGDAENSDGPGNRWVKCENWPPPSTPIHFYLREEGLLSTSTPEASETPDEFDYDPENPVPTKGGRNLNIPAGTFDQSSIESRSDVLVYTTRPLTDSLTVIGKVIVTLWASSDRLDTDFTAKLCDVYPDGHSMLVADGIIQARHRNSLSYGELLTPREIYEFTIDLWSTAIVFAPGHKIRVSISSSNYPRFEKNPNTGEPFRQNTFTLIAHQTVYHDPIYPSALILPVVNGDETKVLTAKTLIPQQTILKQNYPNPFNEETIIELNFPTWDSKNKAHVEIIDLMGRCLYQWNFLPKKGEYTNLRWRGYDQSGYQVPSGVYIYRLYARNIIETQRLILVR